MVEHASGTVAFFHVKAPVLIANVLTVAFVYCFAKIHQRRNSLERRKVLWLIIMVFLFMLYGLYTWSVHPFKK
jgi:hypothetical protein